MKNRSLIPLIRILHKNLFLSIPIKGTPPNVFDVAVGRFRSFVERGILLNLSPYITKSEIKDFYPLAIKAFSYKDSIYGLPWECETLVLYYYNKDLFDKEGLECPNSSWNWQQSLSACKKLTKDVNKDGIIDQYGFILSNWLGEWLPFIWQNNGRLMDEAGTRWLS